MQLVDSAKKAIFPLFSNNDGASFSYFSHCFQSIPEGSATPSISSEESSYCSHFFQSIPEDTATPEETFFGFFLENFSCSSH